MDIHFKPLEENDIVELIDPMTKAFDDDSQRFNGKEKGGPPGYDDGSFLNNWGIKNADSLSYKISIEDKSIGAFIIWWNENGESFLGNIFIDPAFQNKGIGSKAGHIDRKFAATLCSTGTPAAFIHLGEAAHGDLGLIAPGDCIVAFSESGKTNEVIEMLQLGRHLGLKTIIGITAHIDSELRELSDIVIEMGEIKEPCALDLTPCACIAVMLAISDSLALVLMEKKGITRHDFGIRHHGGYLGKNSRLNNE